jgi:hypothetical protein
VCLRSLYSFDVRPRYVSIESDKVSFDALLDEIQVLSGLGYSKFQTVQQRWIQKTRVPAQSREGLDIEYRFTEESSGLFGRDLPSNWKNEEEIVGEYRHIFDDYRKYGDDTFWKKNGFAKYALKAIARLIGRPIPGWYDTHARLVGQDGAG